MTDAAARAPSGIRVFIATCVVFVAGCGGGGGGGAAPAPEQPNRPPVAVQANATIRPVSQHPFSYDVASSGVFSDPDGDPLSYTVTLDSSTGHLTVIGSTVTGMVPFAGVVSFSAVASDGRGGTASASFRGTIVDNSPPTVARTNGAVITVPGAHVNHDATQGGTTFTDIDGDALTYDVFALGAPPGLNVQGTRVIGTLGAIGAATFLIVARDAYGGIGEEKFVVAAPVPFADKPLLPATSYVYDDAELPLPEVFRISREFFGPLWDTTPVSNPTTNAGATLGRVLFYDKRLSATNTHACGSCHHQQRGFTDVARFSTGVAGTALQRNTMALGNVRHNFDNLYFTGRRVTGLEALALLPIEEPAELGNTVAALEQKLAATDFYPPLFTAAFGTPEITSDRISKALAQFLRALLSYRSEFDRAFADLQNPAPENVFSAEELRGMELFNDHGRCSFCHQQQVQILDRPHNDGNNGLDAVFNDQGIFRAASLRNIAVTAPYMHDGRFATLREVIDHYDHGVQFSAALSHTLRNEDGTAARQLNLTEADKDALEAFLNTLTDPDFLTDPRFADPFN